jgi:myo-inositol-1(or 4)-monophosphatase
MQSSINVQAILTAIRAAGDQFVAEYKHTFITTDRAGFMQQLGAIEKRSLAALQTSLAEAFPRTPWHGEEFDYAEQRQPLDLPEYWLCDAMDGAIQYMQHLPGWSINLVLVRAGRPHFAAIYDPLAGELFWAEAGAGAFLNDTPLRPSAKASREVMLAVFEYPLGSAEVPGLNQQTGALVTRLLDYFGVVRNYGPHGLQLAYVGAGRLDAFVQLGLDTYNWLAGILIAREAGASVLTLAGQPWHWGAESLLVTAPGVAEPFLAAAATTATGQPA